MARRRSGRPIHGWIALDKPVGLTSTQALAAVRRAAGAEKAGHAGTLDPLASGLLPIALGEATKTIQWAVGATKRYRLTIRWGEATATDDAEGAVTETSEVRPGEAEIRAALPAFIGNIAQVPSTYSAIRVGGRRAYDLARSGQPPTLAARTVTIESIDVVAIGEADAVLEVVCGKGTYMRSLARDLGRTLGTVAHLSALRRLSVGKLTVERAIPMESVSDLGHDSCLSKHLLPIETALDDIPALALTEAEAARLRHGQGVRPACAPDKGRVDELAEGSVVSVTAGGSLVAIGRIDAGLLRPVRVLNL